MKCYIYIVCAAGLLTACDRTPAYDATGIFEATTVTVSAETSGKILALDVDEGDTVSAGQRTAVIDTAMLVLQRRQLGSQKSATESSSPDVSAQVAALRQQIAHQEHECRRFENLLAANATTRKTLDDAQAQLRILRGQLEAMLSTLGKSRTSLADNAGALGWQQEQIDEQLRKSVITAPADGTVLVKFAEAGEYAVPGKPLYKMADLDRIYLRSYFTASQLADIRLGQEVTVIADFGGDKLFEYPGRITWIAEESEFTPKSIQTSDSRANLVYAVKIAVENDGRLKLGQYGEVRL